MKTPSSMRNLVRKNYKERAQPKNRKNLGMLEKHKDYVVRAKNRAEKKKKLTNLRKKAELKNPDEFYRQMVEKRQKNKYSQKQLKDMTTQDISYAEMKRTMDLKKIEKAQLAFVPDKPQNQHIIFVPSDDDVEDFSATNFFETTPEGLHRVHNRPKKSQLANQSMMLNHGNLKRAAIEEAKHYHEVAERSARATRLSNDVERFDLKKKLMAKGAKVKLKQTQAEKDAKALPRYKWKKVRKR